MPDASWCKTCASTPSGGSVLSLLEMFSRECLASSVGKIAWVSSVGIAWTSSCPGAPSNEDAKLAVETCRRI
eukprot:2498703-Amphidinium_carterae.1